MARSVDTLQAVLNNCDCKLDSVLLQLEDYANRDLNNTSLNFSQQELIDPFRLVSQIKTIKDRLEVTKVKMAELEKLKNEVHRELELKIEGLQPRVESLEK